MLDDFFYEDNRNNKQSTTSFIFYSNINILPEEFIRKDKIINKK